MVVELSAVRLLAPWFGTSLVVWTNVIAVILLALALGYLVGGALAGRARTLGVLCGVLLTAGCLVAWLPQAGAFLARSLLPAEIALHEAAGLIGWGSLAVSLLVFLPPATLLGTVCPLVVETLARARHLSAGRAGGAVLFTSTLGSLAGVFGTSHLLLPTLGLRGTFGLAGGLLFVAGLIAGGLARVPTLWKGAAPCLLVGLSAFAVPAAGPAPRAGLVELASRESPYQCLRVVEDRSQGVPLRYLQVNEGLDSFQSVWQESLGLLPSGFYYNDFLLPAAWSDAEGPWRVLVLGLGAGTAIRVLEGEPRLDLRVTGVELDPAVVELGETYFELKEVEGRVSICSGMDARVALRGTPGPFEQILLDCYSNQVEIPAHLCTFEFFREVRQRLASGGWLTANLGGFDFSDPVVATVASTCADAFDGAVLLVRVPMSRNFMLLARRDGALPWGDGVLGMETREAILALGPRRLPGFARLVEPGGERALTDDWCPIEALQQRSLSEARSRRLSGADS